LIPVIRFNYDTPYYIVESSLSLILFDAPAYDHFILRLQHLISMSLYLSILLVDDDVEDQEIFLDAIKEVDPFIHCACAADGEAALKLLNSDAIVKPDLLFIDLNMPKQNGKQLLMELKKSDTLKDIAVIMYSTFFGENDIKEITKLGAVHYLVKATRFNDLCASLQHILSKRW